MFLPLNSLVTQYLSSISNQYNVFSLLKEASARSYYRVQFPDKSLVLCHDPNFKQEPYDFLTISKIYADNGISVPEVLCIDPQNNLILTTDGGEKDLTSIQDDAEFESYLDKSIDVILQIQSISPTPPISNRGFYYEKLNYEVQFTYSAYQRFSQKHLVDVEVTTEFFKFMDDVCLFLSKYSSMVVCHRDYHARNILLKEDGSITIIDYQDSMMGTPVYDLASLLYDAYRPISRSFREKLFLKFKEKQPNKEKRLREYYLTQCLQRSFKALGSYFMLYNDKGYTKYAPSILKAIDNLLEIVEVGMFPDSLFLFFYQLKNKLSSSSFLR